MYRNRKLLNLANGAPCVGCDAEDGTVCGRHANLIETGKGRGIKAHDCAIMFLCDDCDRRLNNEPRAKIREYTYMFIYRTHLWLWENNKIGVL